MAENLVTLAKKIAQAARAKAANDRTRYDRNPQKPTPLWPNERGFDGVNEEPSGKLIFFC